MRIRLDHNQKKILNTLLDAYEKSRTFQGTNQVRQSFSLQPEKLFPVYADDAEYDRFASLNEEMRELEAAGFVTLESKKNGVITRVTLCQESLEACYRILGRRSRREMQAGLRAVLERYAGKIRPETGVSAQGAGVSAEGADVFAQGAGVSAEGADVFVQGAGVSAEGADVFAQGAGISEQETGYASEAKRNVDENQPGQQNMGKQDFTGSRRITAVHESDPLEAYAQSQLERIAQNKNVEYYDESDAEFQDFADLLLLARSALDHEEEVFVRDFSMRLFGDSKRVEQLRPKVQGLLFQYGNFDERETVLAECGVIATPTYVSVKGNLRLTLGAQQLDLSALCGDISFSTATLSDITSVRVMGRRVVTVENLTSFHDYQAGEDTVIYLGGFHNAVKRRFLEQLYRENPAAEYCHFGDLDAGGFYILSHLRRKTKIPFRPLYMDAETLKKYRQFTKPLSTNDRKRLQLLLEMPEFSGTDGDVIRYMLEHDCKLEQEAVSAW